MLKIGVLVSGGGTNLQAIIDNIKSGYIKDTEVCVVISNNEGVYSLERAKENGIPYEVISPKSYPDRETFAKAMVETLKGYGAELVVLAGYLVKVPEILIQAYPDKIMNIHPALIPSFCGKGYYGLKVHEGVLERGVKLTGATVHFVNADLDAGPIILQKAVEVKKGDTPEILQKRVMEQAEWKILPQAVKLYAEGRLEFENGKVYVKAE